MNSIDQILKAANKVLLAPSTTLETSCKEFGVKISPTTMRVMGSIVPMSFIPLFWLANKLKKNQRERQEKERMKNEVICMQQAIIQKLKRENTLNQQEIKNLQDTLQMLENVISRLDVA